MSTRRRLGFSFLWFGARVDERHAPWFERLAALGYDGAELPINAMSEDDAVWLRRVCNEHGLATIAIGVATPEANPIDDDPAVRRAAVAHLAQLCERTAAIGAEVLTGPLHSAYKTWSQQPPTAEERERCVDVLRAAGEHAARCGVRIAVEPINRFECYFLNTVADAASLVKQVAHPCVTVAVDTHHMHIEEGDMVGTIAAHGASFGHVQLSENHRGTPGTGQVDFAAVLAALDRVGYAGWLVIEAFSRHDPAFGSMVNVWRPLDGGVEEVLVAGARLLGRG